MNGDVKSYAEQSAMHAESAARSAMRSEQKHQATVATVLELGQIVGRMERELREMRSEMTVGLTSVRDAMRKMGATGPVTHTHITDEDWTDSPTGTHVQVSKRTFDKWAREKELSVDAKRWRKVLGIVWKVGGAIALLVTGWLVRHYLGKP